MKDPQQTADELVDNYKKYSHRPDRLPENNRLTEETNNAIQCAILHTQGIIDEICYQAKSTGGRMFGKEYTNLRLKFHQQVLTILKTRL